MELQKRAVRRVAAVVVGGLLLAACSPQPTPPPPAPAPVTTPVETQLERQQRLDFEAAEKSYRAFHSEYTRLSQSGGTRQPTAVMKLEAGGPYLQFMADYLAQTQAAGTRAKGVVNITYVRPGVYSPTALDLQICEDGSNVTNVNRQGEVISRGVAVRLRLDVHRVGNKWKVWDGDDEEVTTCG